MREIVWQTGSSCDRPLALLYAPCSPVVYHSKPTPSIFQTNRRKYKLAIKVEARENERWYGDDNVYAREGKSCKLIRCKKMCFTCQQAEKRGGKFFWNVSLFWHCFVHALWMNLTTESLKTICNYNLPAWPAEIIELLLSPPFCTFPIPYLAGGVFDKKKELNNETSEIN